VLPAVWSHANPVDIIGDATPERYREAIDLCLQDPGVDGAIVILTPQAMTQPTRGGGRRSSRPPRAARSRS
jgi:acetyltransferase